MTVLGDTCPPRFPIGQSDYALLRRQRLTYVDKTMWVADVLRDSAAVLLVPRPRRFGKTLNMTTLRYFVERCCAQRTDLFEDTAVWTAHGGQVREHFQRYPVIYLTFKDLKEPSMAALADRMRPLLAESLRDLEKLHGRGDGSDSDDLRIDRLQDPTSPMAGFTDMLRVATKWLHRITGEQAVVLIDEHDAPLHAAWQYGYWDEAVLFFRNFLSAGLKDNPHLFKGVLTGILKVAKEGIFSGLNHLRTDSVLSDAMAAHFGFTEDEVSELVACAPTPHDPAALRQWYNGYRFGQARPVTVYNPWSVLNYLDAPGLGPRSFWKNTSDNDIIHSLMHRHAASMGPAVQTWLEGGTVERTIDEDVALVQLADHPNAVFGLLLFSGYLTVAGIRAAESGLVVDLRIPNAEVRGVFTEVFRAWIEQAAGGEGPDALAGLTRALLTGDAGTLERELGALLRNGMSMFDFGRRPLEAIYQAFVVGLLLHLERTHRVRSNRESGYGRADVLVIPRQGGVGAVLELKVIETDYDESRELALERAAKQIVDRNYSAAVRAAGAGTVYQYAVVFDGKRCWVHPVPDPSPTP